ncbi:MAG: insulinase family protein, partial [Akkermansiaceae bacterium]|nr:insulinase family protein [Armatimonadota bacterium]
MKTTISVLAAAAFLLTATAGAQDAVPSTSLYPSPPPPATPRIVEVPKVAETKLPNGLRVLGVSRPGSGLVTVQLLMRSGAADDPAGKNGRASMVAELLTKGTKTRSATQIADGIEQIGASLGAGAGYDSTSVTLSVLKSRLDAAMPIFADVVQNPTFPAGELDRLRKQTLDDLSVSYRQPGTLARLVAARALYGGAPYGNSVVGTPQTLGKISRADLGDWHRSLFQPAQSVLIVSGDISAEEVSAMAARYLGTW